MEIKHWIFLILVFVVGYFVGVKFNGIGNAVIGSVPNVTL